MEIWYTAPPQVMPTPTTPSLLLQPSPPRNTAPLIPHVHGPQSRSPPRVPHSYHNTCSPPSHHALYLVTALSRPQIMIDPVPTTLMVNATAAAHPPQDAHIQPYHAPGLVAAHSLLDHLVVMCYPYPHPSGHPRTIRIPLLPFAPLSKKPPKP